MTDAQEATGMTTDQLRELHADVGPRHATTDVEREHCPVCNGDDLDRALARAESALDGTQVVLG